MSKKRVHEIAKELKDTHDIELDNKAVVTELQALGYDVKSHSSSLEDDQAQAAILKIVERRRPKAAPAPVAPKGFVVRRRVGEGAVHTMVAAAPTPGAKYDEPPPPEPPAAPPVASAVAPDGSEVPAPAATAAPDLEATPPAHPAASVPVATATPVPSAPPAASPLAASARPSAPRLRASAPRGAGGGMQTPPPSVPAQAVPPTVRPGGAVPPMVRPSAPRTGAPVRPAGAIAIGPTTLAAPAPAAPRMPTATQAVVISRPLIAVKRVTPTQPTGRYPLAPGRKAIGEVRQIAVRPNQFPGAPKDDAATRAKEKERPKRGRTPEKEGGPTTTDIREMVYGRVAIPLRGKKKKPTKKGQKTLITEMAEEKKVIKVQEGVTVSDLSQRMGVKTTEIIKKLMASGKMATANQTLDAETAAVVATDYGWQVKKVGMEVEDFLPKFEEKPDDFVARPPVVTVMGHVDHGKTSLLDAIREAHVAEGEAGGITQHIGAYTVKGKSGDITFLDTPGHEAFSAMRARGANITDVVVLVVAADDGVMPQTKEAIAHAQKAEVPIVVAVNKMDVAGANLDRVKKELADNGLLAEDWGGEVIVVPVSARTRAGLDLLVENVGLQAEVLELKANPTRPAQGTILEARLEKGRGPVATVLVEEGTLNRGDAIVTGVHHGRVRMLINDRGQLIETLRPGYSAEVIGLSGVPMAGDVIHAVADEKAAKAIADHRALKARQAEAGKTSRETLDDLLARQKTAEQKDLKLVLKADVAGSLEACADAITKLSTKKVKVTIVQKGVGMMTETDINNAAAFGAMVMGFNSKPESGAEAAAKALEVKWETFGIIYELLDGVVRHMEDLLEPLRQEKKLGKAEVRNLFNVPRLGVVAGSAVVEGVVKRSANVRVWRASQQVFQGKVASLKRFKEDVREVGQGYECGIGIESFSEFQAGDVIEAFEIEEIRPSLN